MKKLLKLVLALAMCATMMSMTVFAADSGSIAIDSQTAELGQAVSVDVSITGNPGVAALVIVPEYDSNVLTLDSITGSGLAWTTGKAASWSDAANTTYTGKILTLNFTVNENAAFGTTPVSVSVDASNYDEELVSFSISSGTVTIECKHVYGEGSITTPATCEGTGVMTYTCTRGCGNSYTEVIPATGHTEKTVNAKEATCSAEGYTGDVICSVCETVIKKGTAIAKTEHDYKWVIDQEATTDAAGLKHEECTVCGAKRNEGTVIPKKEVPSEHICIFGGLGMDELYHWTYCSCGAIEGKAPHNFVDADTPGMLRCVDCGYETAKTSGSVATGDSSNLVLWIGLMVAAAGTVTAATYRRKKCM